MQRAVGPRLNPRRLHLGAEHAAININDCYVWADEPYFPGCQCNRASLQRSAKNFIVPPIKFFAAYMKYSIHIGERGVITIACRIRIGVTAVPSIDQFAQ